MSNNNTVMDIKINNFAFNNSIPILSDISFDIQVGQVIGIVGDSGCGKTTLGKLLVNYYNINGDDVTFDGNIKYYHNDDIYDIYNKSKQYYDTFSVPPVQMIFQDSKTSINLKMTVRDLIQESLSLGNSIYTVEELSRKLLIDSKLDTMAINLSGGQRRRLGISKIMAGLSTLPEDIPKIIIADEPVASLDASIKHEIMNCIIGMKSEGYTIIVISHDIHLIKNISDVIYVVNKVPILKNQVGTIVEEWDPNTTPIDEKTKQLINDSNHMNNFLLELNKVYVE
jgi:ABC-type dipeptide/oligopeptide/nickel transport system ATPase subunit